MRPAIGAMHLGTRAPKAFVYLGANGLGVQWIKKRRPACAAVVFGVGGKEWLAAADAGVGAGLLVVGVFAGEGSLGGFVSRHIKGQRLSAFFFEQGAPLVVGFLDFVVGHGGWILARKEKISFRTRKTQKLREKKTKKKEDLRIRRALASFNPILYFFLGIFRVFRVTFAPFASGSSVLKRQEEQEISIVEAQSGGKVA
jgi:hypothetical protein